VSDAGRIRESPVAEHGWHGPGVPRFAGLGSLPAPGEQVPMAAAPSRFRAYRSKIAANALLGRIHEHRRSPASVWATLAKIAISPSGGVACGSAGW